MRHLPNLVSLLRLLLSPLVPFTVSTDLVWEGLLIFALLSLSDALDGFLARRLKAQTTLGKFLDPLADKVLMFNSLLALLMIDKGPSTLILFKTALVRDIFLIIGTLALRKYNFVPEPSFFGKVSTFLLSVTICVSLGTSLYTSQVLEVLSLVLKGGSVILLVVSGVDYLVKALSFIQNRPAVDRK